MKQYAEGAPIIHFEAWVILRLMVAERRLVQMERALADRDRRIDEGDAIPASFYKRLEAADNAMRQALSDFEWIERMVPGSNLQASILLLRHALAHDKGKDAEGK
jgi:hypothetical protein